MLPREGLPIERLRAGGIVTGTMFRILGHPAAALMAKDAGMDLVMFDMEHGAFDIESLSVAFASAVEAGVAPMVRVPELSRAYVSRALDIGAAGVMVPMLETHEQAERLVGWAKYPPLGNRGFSASGGLSGYRKINDVATAMNQMNRRTLAIAQIETAASVDNVDAIAAVEGIDVLLAGPNDLAISLGTPGDIESPVQVEAIACVAEAARKNGKVFGMHSGISYLRRWIPAGLRFIMNSIDIDVLRNGLHALANEVERAVAEACLGEQESGSGGS